MTYCLLCSSALICDDCTDGYYPNSLGSCANCPTHCTLCEYDPGSSSADCTACETNFSLTQNVPRSCP